MIATISVNGKRLGTISVDKDGDVVVEGIGIKRWVDDVKRYAGEVYVVVDQHRVPLMPIRERTLRHLAHYVCLMASNQTEQDWSYEMDEPVVEYRGPLIPPY